MKEFLEKYGMALSLIRAYIRKLPVKERLQIWAEIQEYFDEKNSSYLFKSQRNEKKENNI